MINYTIREKLDNFYRVGKKGGYALSLYLLPIFSISNMISINFAEKKPEEKHDILATTKETEEEKRAKKVREDAKKFFATEIPVCYTKDNKNYIDKTTTIRDIIVSTLYKFLGENSPIKDMLTMVPGADAILEKIANNDYDDILFIVYENFILKFLDQDPGLSFEMTQIMNVVSTMVLPYILNMHVLQYERLLGTKLLAEHFKFDFDGKEKEALELKNKFVKDLFKALSVMEKDAEKYESFQYAFTNLTSLMLDKSFDFKQMEETVLSPEEMIKIKNESGKKRYETIKLSEQFAQDDVSKTLNRINEILIDSNSKTKNENMDNDVLEALKRDYKVENSSLVDIESLESTMENIIKTQQYNQVYHSTPLDYIHVTNVPTYIGTISYGNVIVVIKIGNEYNIYLVPLQTPEIVDEKIETRFLKRQKLIELKNRLIKENEDKITVTVPYVDFTDKKQFVKTEKKTLLAYKNDATNNARNFNNIVTSFMKSNNLFQNAGMSPNDINNMIGGSDDTN